jgi:hypothetical protein
MPTRPHHDRTAGVPGRACYSLPTVRFDPARVTNEIKADLRKNVEATKEFERSHFDQVYEAALLSVSRGGDLAVLFNAIMALHLPGMTKKKAGAISSSLNSKATALMTRDQQLAVDAQYAVWMHSGAPCIPNHRSASDDEFRRADAHKAANGRRYEVATGMLIDGRWTRPGVDEGCKCVSRIIIPGLE